MKKHIIKALCLVCILVGMHHGVSAAELLATTISNEPGSIPGGNPGDSGPTVAGPNLVSNIAKISQGIQNSPLTLNATVKNIGTAGTVNGFTDTFSYKWSDSGVYYNLEPAWVKISSVAKSALASGAESADTARFTPTRTGTLIIQHCVDSSNSINEGLGEDGNNCSETSFTVSKAGSASSYTPSYYNPSNTGAINGMTIEQRNQLIATLRQLIQLLQSQLNSLPR